MNSSLEWAIIPAAGSGTRLRPATDYIPKVMMPIGLRPMLAWALDEVFDAEVANVVVVVSPQHGSVSAYLDDARRSREWPSGTRLHVVEQPQPAGIGDALTRCREVTGDAAFGVVVPDNWFIAEPPALAQVAASHARTGLHTFALVDVEQEEAALLGNSGGVTLEAIDGPDFRVVSLADKTHGAFAVGDTAASLRGCARYVLDAAFYDALAATTPTEATEWDDVPAFQYLIERGRVGGCRIDGRLFDVGQEPGYLAAMNYCFERSINDSDA